MPASWASRLAGPPKSKSQGAMIRSAPWSINSTAALPTVTGSDLPSMIDELDLLAEQAARIVQCLDRDLRTFIARGVERRLDTGQAKCATKDDFFIIGVARRGHEKSRGRGDERPSPDIHCLVLPAHRQAEAVPSVTTMKLHPLRGICKFRAGRKRTLCQH